MLTALDCSTTVVHLSFATSPVSSSPAASSGVRDECQQLRTLISNVNVTSAALAAEAHSATPQAGITVGLPKGSHCAYK